MSVLPKARIRFSRALAFVAGAALLPGMSPRPEPEATPGVSEIEAPAAPRSKALAELLERLAADDPMSPVFEVRDIEDTQNHNAESLKPWLLER